MYIYYNKNNKNTVMISDKKIESDSHDFIKKNITEDEKDKMMSANYETRITNNELEIIDKKKSLKDEIDMIETVDEMKEFLKNKL